jgi:hypothetical protein
MSEGNGVDSSAFDAWLNRFFAHYYERRPVNATFIGVHDYDHLLPDCSPAGLDLIRAEMRQLRDDLERIGDAGLSEAQRQDRQLAAGFLDIQLWEVDSSHFYRGNPSAYTGEGAFSIIGLFQRDSEPLAERVGAGIARMRLLPDYLAQGRANVTAAPVPWTETAIREAKAAIAYFERGVPILAQERGIDESGFLEAAEIARQAFVTHLAYLESELLQSLADHFASGQEAFDRYLARGHCLPEGRDSVWVADYARGELAAAKEALAVAADARDPKMPWREQLAALSDLHPTLDEYYGTFGRVWDEARAFAIEHDLVTWPDYPIEFVPVPRSDREAREGLYYLFYRCPPPFGKPETHRYLVTPIEPEMPAEEQERRLRANSDYTIKQNHVVHHAGLGHHVQNYNAFRAASRIGKIAGVDCASRIALFCGGTLVEGWACYTTDLMNEAGFLTPLEELAERNQRVRMCARAVADVAIHTGEMTIEDAAAFYARETAMTEAAAKGEAIKNSMFPGAAMMYLIGLDAIHDLRRDVQAREGAAFSLRRFHDRFLSYGAIPVALIREAMLSDLPA